MSFTAADKQKAAERELAFRRRVYPRRIAEGRMRQSEADREIAIMEAIAADYRSEAEVKARNLDLFGGR